MNINFTYDPGTSLNQMLTFEVAGKVWERHFTDDVTVNLHVGVTDSSNLPDKVIGGALPGMQFGVRYRDFRDSIRDDATSSLDQKAITGISGSSARFKHELRLINSHQDVDYSIELPSHELNMTTANAKALGLAPAHQNLDGYILLSNLRGQGVAWDQTSDSLDSNKLDLLTTATHEIGHALGFVSGVDQPGAIAAVQNNTSQLSSVFSRTSYLTTLDQFRYSAEDTLNITYGSELSNKYFSVDGGETSLAQFSSGADKSKGGDGFQASHWNKSRSGGTIMAPTLRKGQRTRIKELDLKAFDAIGWDRSSRNPNASLGLKALRLEAQAELAQKAGKSWSWLNQNRNQAENRLSEVRVADVVEMAINSQVYDLSWMNQYGGASYFLNWAQNAGGQSFWLNWWNNGGGDAWWQSMDELFEQRGLYSQLDEEGFETPQDGVDAVTGLPSQQAVVPPAVGDAVVPSSDGPVDLFSGDRFQAFEKAFDQQSSSSNKGFSSIDLDLGTASLTVAETLGQGLSSLGQDQLQGLGAALVGGLGQAF